MIMGITIDDMEFHWRWKWNAGSRPSQWGWTRWLTVPEYYSTFCHWKDNMLSHGCPAEEGNYIDAFLENLRQELSIKVIHRRSQMSSLAVAFCYAALEEMRMNIDAKFEESRLKKSNVNNEFEASKVFDKIPSRDAQKEFSSVILPRVFDKSPDRISEAFVSLEAGVKLDNGVDCYEELEYEDDASGLIATNEDFNSMLATTAIHWDKEDGGQGDSARTTGETKNSVDEEMENGACEVFAEMSQSIIESLMKEPQASGNEDSHSTVEEVLEVENILDYEGKATANCVLGDQGLSENGAYKVLDGMTISVEACLQLFPLNYITQGEWNWLSDGDFQPPALRIGSVEVAHHQFEEMSKSIPAEVGNQLPDEVGQLHSLKFESLISDGVIYPFDPGGRCVFYKARDPLESNKEEHKLDKFRGISFDSDSAVNMIRYYQCKPMLLSVEETKVLPTGSNVFMSPNNQGEVWVFLLKEFMVNINGSSSQSSCVQQGTVYVVRKIFEPIASNSNKRMTHHLISQVEDQENESTRRRYFGNNTCDIQHHMAEQLAVAGINRIPHIELAQEFSIKGANLFYILKKLEFNGLIVQQLTLVWIKDASELKNKPVLMTDVFCLHWNAEFSDCQWTLAKFEQKKSAYLNLLKELIDYGYTVCGSIIEGNDVFVGGNDVYRYELRSAHESERSICPTLMHCWVDLSVNHMDKALSVPQVVKTLIDELMHLQLRVEAFCCMESPNCLEPFFTGNTEFGESGSVSWANSWQVVNLIKNYQRMASDGSLNGEQYQLLLIELGNFIGMKLNIMVDMLKIVLPLATVLEITVLETTVMEIREGFMSSIWFGECVGPNIDSKFQAQILIASFEDTYANVLAHIQTRLRSRSAQGIRFRFGWQTMSYEAMRVVVASNQGHFVWDPGIIWTFLCHHLEDKVVV